MTKTRREFLLESSLAAGAIMAGSALADEVPLPDGTTAHRDGAPPERRRPTIRSVQSGDWSDRRTWGGRVPTERDVAQISHDHIVRHDGPSTVGGVEVVAGGTLEFDAARSSTLQSTGNIVVAGVLRMSPASAEIEHTIRFAGIKEQRFVGGGMDPIDSDVGLWVTGGGELELLGEKKTSWTRAVGHVARGTQQIELRDATGWRVGDEIVVVPTDTTPDDAGDWDDATNRPLDRFAEKFERRIISAIDGHQVSFGKPLAHDHAMIETDTGKAWTAEVANLSRNVRIEGTADGRAHIFIRSTKPQSIRYVAGRHLGPRNLQKGHRRPQLVLGRYALHFHHCHEGSRGTVVEGCALSDTGNRNYVPHLSHGIAMRDNVSFNSMEAGFWWDFQELSHDTVWERNLVALVQSNGIDRTTMGMALGQGDGNIARENVVVYGHHGDEHGHGGYVWDANNEGVWVFERNLSHSNRTGLFVWQNTSLNHTIVDHESYADYLAIFHGAYANSYTYTRGYVHGGIVRVKATSGNASGVRFEQMTFDGGGQALCCVEIYPSPATSQLDANAFRQCTFRNAAIAALMNTFPIGDEKTRKLVDLILCDFHGIDRMIDFTKESTADSTFRIQPAKGDCSLIEHRAGEREIKPFAPYHYGSGVGLTGRYYNGVNFDTLALTRVDSMVMFQQWSLDKGASPTQVHHRIMGDSYSVRWTGKLEPQFTEPHTFYLCGGAGFRLWVDGQKVLNAWSERPDNSQVLASATIDLVQGRKYDLRLETFNESGTRGCQLYWQCDSLGRMVHVPQSQLYPAA